eukprot:6050883-Amphidinium_carterae.1
MVRQTGDAATFALRTEGFERLKLWLSSRLNEQPFLPSWEQIVQMTEFFSLTKANDAQPACVRDCRKKGKKERAAGLPRRSAPEAPVLPDAAQPMEPVLPDSWNAKAEKDLPMVPPSGGAPPRSVLSTSGVKKPA